MAGRGPAPKPPSERRRRNSDPANPNQVTPDEQVRGPELPSNYDWPQRTRDWWATWRRSPQAQTFLGTDWDFLLDTAFMHAEYALGDMKLGAEIRLRVAKFGATPEDRARLRLEVEQPDEQPTPARRGVARKPAAKSTRDPRARLQVVDGSAS